MNNNIIDTEKFRKLIGQDTSFMDGQNYQYQLTRFADNASTIKILNVGTKPREAGIIYRNLLSNKIFYYMHRDPEKHLLRKLNAYGINETIFTYFKPDAIIIDTPGKLIGADYDVVNNCKNFLHFKTQQFERQRFIPLNLLQEVIKDEHNELTV